MKERIVVFGASGFTGGLVCRALAAKGLPFAVAGRNREKLEAVAEETGAADVIIADASRPKTLAALFAGGTRVLASCAGPFLRHGWPVVEAAVEAGVHYLDTTGEQPFIKRVADWLDGTARERGSTVVSAMAMEYAVGDWTAGLAMGRCPMREIEEVVVAYSLTGGAITRGTALSIFEMFGRPGWSWEGGRFRRRSAGFTGRTIPFPFGERYCPWMPFGEVVFLARRGNVGNAATFMRMPRLMGAVLPWTSLLGRAGRPALRPAVRALVARRPAAPTPSQRRHSRFTIVAGADGSRVVASGTDPYGLTAEIMALGCEHLLGNEAPRGVRSPATIGLDPVASLKAVGVIVE